MITSKPVDPAVLAAAKWRTASDPGGSSCVEVAHLGDGMTAVRDSTNRGAAALVFDADEWAAFTAGVRDGRLD